jgi:hypothetical protein
MSGVWIGQWCASLSLVNSGEVWRGGNPLVGKRGMWGLPPTSPAL